MEKFRILEIGAVVMGGGIPLRSLCGNLVGGISTAFPHAKLIPLPLKTR
jgi:hypothetical protein